MKLTPKIVYLRDKKRRPEGCLAYVIDGEYIYWGVSVRAPKDERNKLIAKDIALARLDKALGANDGNSGWRYGQLPASPEIPQVQRHLWHLLLTWLAIEDRIDTPGKLRHVCMTHVGSFFVGKKETGVYTDEELAVLTAGLEQATKRMTEETENVVVR